MEAYFFALRTRWENTTNSPFKRMAGAPVPRQRGTGLFRPLVAYFEIGSGPFWRTVFYTTLVAQAKRLGYDWHAGEWGWGCSVPIQRLLCEASFKPEDIARLSLA